MAVSIRDTQATDAAECGRVVHAAFATIAAQHNFPPDFPSAEVATAVASMLIAHPEFHGVVAETDGRIVGSNFLDTRSLIGGIGPITISPSVQNTGIGRQLMQIIMEHAVAKKMFRDQIGARCLSQSLALPLCKIGFCDARTAFGDARSAAQAATCGLRGPTSDRHRHRCMQCAMPPRAWLRSRRLMLDLDRLACDACRLRCDRACFCMRTLY